MNDIGSLTGRLWVKMLLLMALLTAVGPLVDYGSFVQGVFGTINNLSIIFLMGFVGIFVANLRHLRENGDRAFLLGGLILVMYIFMRTILDADADLIGGIGGATLVLWVVLAGFGAYALARRGLEVHEWVVKAVMLSAIFLPLAVVLIALRPDGEDPYYLNVYGYSNVRVMGYFAAGATVATSLMWGWARGTLSQPLLGAFALLSVSSWSMLFWSGSRTGFVGVVAALLVSWIIIRVPGWMNFLATMGAAAVGFALHLTYIMPSHHFGFLSRIEHTAKGLSSGDMTKISTNRSDMWAWAIDRILESPWIGHGLYPMSHMRTPEFNFFHTHNVILEYALGVGIPAALLVIATVFTLYVRAGIAARRSKDPFAVACFGIVTAAAVAGQFSAALFFPFYLMVFIFGLAGLVAVYKE